LLKKEVVQAQRFSNEWSRGTETCTSVEHKKATTKTIRWSWPCTDKKEAINKTSLRDAPNTGFKEKRLTNPKNIGFSMQRKKIG
jgi:hypothetical protein